MRRYVERLARAYDTPVTCWGLLALLLVLMLFGAAAAVLSVIAFCALKALVEL